MTKQLSEQAGHARSALKAYYDDRYHRAIHFGMIADECYYSARAEAFARLYFAPEERHLAVLDYGCGLGQTVAALTNAYGFDASSEARDIARKRGVRIFDSPGEIPSSSFDVVICRHVLEHVPDPLDVLTALGTYLRHDGKLILVLPRERHSASHLEPDAHMHIYSWNFCCINNLLSLAELRATRNRTLYNLGYRALLPLRRFVGPAVYELATGIVGRLMNNGELVIHATRIR